MPKPTSEIGIYRTAKVLIDRHGEDASFHAAQRANAMLDKGDVDGLGVWKRVLDLTSQPGSQTVH